MEDVIYIIIGLLWLVFTFYVQSKKKKKQQEARSGQPSTPSSQQPKTFFEKIFSEDLSPQPQYQEPEPELEEEFLEYENENNSPGSFREEYEKLGVRSLEQNPLKNTETKGMIYSESGIENELEITSKQGVGKEPEEGLEFDLRTAVIMAEILERPYS